MTVPPYLLLDVDGVLNPFPGPGGSLPAGYRPHRLSPPGYSDIPVWLDPRHGAWVSTLCSTGPLRPMWASSWQAGARDLIGPRLDMPEVPFLELGSPDIETPHPQGYLWKRDLVEERIGEVPTVWIDDDFTDMDYAWATARTKNGAPTLLLQPDPYQGLEYSHVASARLWVSALKRRTDGQYRREPWKEL